MKKQYIHMLLSISVMVPLYAAAPFPTLQQGGTTINIGLDEQARNNISTQLNSLLSDEYVLATKTQSFHWNVTGPFFGPLHCLFGKQYESLLEFIDQIAERIRALGFFPVGTLKEFLAQTSLQEDANTKDDTGMIRNLLQDHETIIRKLREIITAAASLNDHGTNNMLSNLIEKHEKTAWMLRAHLR